MSSRTWIFTTNNPQSVTINWEAPEWKGLVKLAVWQLEKGESGTPHLQGYVELRSPRRLAFLRERLPGTHLEKRRGTKLEAINYVTKEETRVEGPFSYPSTISLDTLKTEIQSTDRISDLLLVKSLIDQGKDEGEIADIHFETWCRHWRAFERYRRLRSQPRNHEVQVHVVYGPTGTGKSRWAMDEFPGAYWKQRSNWWDGYEGQSTVVLDEFYGWLPYDTLLRICDRYPLLVESKGGQINFLATCIIITSNSIPSNWYKNVYFDSFIRRVTKWHFLPFWGSHATYNTYSEALKQYNTLNLKYTHPTLLRGQLPPNF